MLRGERFDAFSVLMSFQLFPCLILLMLILFSVVITLAIAHVLALQRSAAALTSDGKDSDALQRGDGACLL